MSCQQYFDIWIDFYTLPLYKRCLSNLALLYWWFLIFLIYLFLFWFLIEGRYFQFGSVLKKCSKSLFLNFLKSKNKPFHVWLKKYLYISNSLKQSQICKKLLTHQHQKWKKKEKMRSLFNPRVVLRSYTVIYFLIFSLGKWPVLEIWFELFSLKSIKILYDYELPLKFWEFIWYTQKCWQFL